MTTKIRIIMDGHYGQGECRVICKFIMRDINGRIITYGIL